MNRVISDTAEYGCYLFDHAAKPMLSDFMAQIDKDVIGTSYNEGLGNGVDNGTLIEVNRIIRSHPVEAIGSVLRRGMTAMKAIHTGASQ